MRCFALCATAGWLALSASAARAQDAASAQTFVTGLYAAYRHHPGPDYLGPVAKDVFSARLLALIRRAALANGEVGALDGDPICDCQDASGLRLRELTTVSQAIAGRPSGKLIATVRLRGPDGSRTLRLDLIAVDGHWRVDDVHTHDTPSLAAYLRQHAGGR
jgi:hypothetical protein